MNRNDDQLCFTAVNEALQVISGKWAFLVISQLYYDTQRFNQLKRNLDPISIKSLTDILRHLEQHQIIHRQVIPTIPISVEYSLTEKGKAYRTVLLQMRQWGERWITNPDE
ncbi:winged helix-turn-helix transcriptional regulator [Paenibacillus sepulcri]|uniref:Helix-turn-helix transcriptional regulator n=1 Tax=Paenibacillus sepulcri TaxID=359917 RepID=A0ABS7C6T4_9BACL|nr:helix-turn-helix transcriptional regulator [Paenibacillus sepulcri]